MSHHLLQTSSFTATGAPSMQTFTDTVSYCGPFEYRYGGKELLTSDGH